VCTKNGIFLFKIYLNKKRMTIEVFDQGEQEEGEDGFTFIGYLPEETVKAAV
jgi:hypothetical protein